MRKKEGVCSSLLLGGGEGIESFENNGIGSLLFGVMMGIGK